MTAGSGVQQGVPGSSSWGSTRDIREGCGHLGSMGGTTRSLREVWLEVIGGLI